MHAAALPDAADWRGPLGSLALHLLAFVLFVFVVPKPRPVNEAEPPILVEIISPGQPAPPERATKRSTVEAGNTAARPIPSSPNRDVGIPRLSPRSPTADADVPPLMRPEKILSQGALANPRSSAAKRQLRTLAAEERAVQLCNIEAMEQLHAWKAALLPEAVVAYATKRLKIRGGSIIADGAAFYSASSWHRLRFECDVRGDEVVSFAYSVGDSIPRSEWEAYSLPEQVADDDG